MGTVRISKDKLDMGGAPIKNIGAPTEAADAATKNYVDDFVVDSVEKTGRAATYVVAASGAPDHVKAQADFVCDGTDDQVEIQAAVDALPDTGGDIVFVGPRFIFGDTVTTTKPSIRWLGGGGSTWLGGAEATAVGAVEFATSAAIQILEVGSPTTVTHRGHHFENIVFRDISAGQDTALGGLMIRRQNHTRITNCSFMNFQKSGAVGLGFQQTSICPIIMGVLARQCDTAILLRAGAAHVIGGFIALCKLGIDVPLGAELFFDGNIDVCDVGIHLKTDGSWIEGRFENNTVSVKVSRNNNVVGGVHANNSTTDVEIEAGSNQTLLTLRMFGGTPTIVDNGTGTVHINRFQIRGIPVRVPGGSAAEPSLDSLVKTPPGPLGAF